MIVPTPIYPGSKIRIVAPAGKVSEKYVIPAAQWLTDQGYNVVLGQHVFNRHFQFAGTDKQRLHDLQQAIDDSETDAIICARGGYGTVRIINQLDFSKFKENPKWLVGFSDITVIHACLNKLQVASIHATMPRYFFDENGNVTENLETLMHLLAGKPEAYTIDHQSNNKKGVAAAELVGGNLSIVSSLTGTKFDMDTNGKILFLEDIDEFLYHTDRMVNQLKLAGKLDQLVGLIVGDFTNMKDNDSPFGASVQEIILEAVKEFNYPVIFGFPAGHDQRNLALAFGKKYKIEVTDNKSIVTLI